VVGNPEVLIVLGAALIGAFAVAVLILVIKAMSGSKPKSQPPAAVGGRCSNPDCGAENDPGAKFCRRCGKPLA
jgi:hypothetical protein